MRSLILSRCLRAAFALSAAAVWLLVGHGASAQQFVARDPADTALASAADADDHLSVITGLIASADAGTRLKAAVWLGSRSMRAYSPLLARLSRDPDPRVAMEARLGLAGLRSTPRLERSDLIDLDGRRQAELIARGVRSGLFRERDVRRLLEDRPAWLTGMALLEAARLSEDVLGHDAAADLWLEAWRHTADDAVRLEAALRAWPHSDDHALARWLETTAYRLPARATAAALMRTDELPSAEAFAVTVLAERPERDVRIAAFDRLVRSAPHTSGLRRAWAGLRDGAETPADDAVLAAVLLRADTSAAAGGPPLPTWLAGDAAQPTQPPATRLAGRLIASNASDLNALGELTRAFGHPGQPVVAWAEARGGPALARVRELLGRASAPVVDPINLRFDALAREFEQVWPRIDRAAELRLVARLRSIRPTHPGRRLERAWMLAMTATSPSRALAGIPNPSAADHGRLDHQDSRHASVRADTLSYER
ncbi:MAG: hypothetical protein AAGF47_06125 [Planctomycetota bacterium]